MVLHFWLVWIFSKSVSDLVKNNSPFSWKMISAFGFRFNFPASLLKEISAGNHFSTKSYLNKLIKNNMNKSFVKTNFTNNKYHTNKMSKHNKNDINNSIKELNQFNDFLKSNLLCDSIALKALYLSNNKNILTNNVNKIISLFGFSSDLVLEVFSVIIKLKVSIIY